MANSKQAITSLLTEHFRYTPLTLLDDIINTVNELLYRAVTAVEEGLNSAPAASLGFAERAVVEKRTPEKDPEGNALYPEARAEIENGVHQLETLLEATIDKTFDKLEIYVLRNILTVDEDLAPWMKLGHYEGLDFTPRQDAPTPESLYMLRRKVHETRKLHNALRTETSRNAALISQLQTLLYAPSSQTSPQNSSQPGSQTPASTPSLSFLTSTPAAKSLGISYDVSMNSQQPLTTQTTFAISQLPALRQHLTTLRPKLESLRKIPLRDEPDERRMYIEEQTRRHLERRGADMETGEGLLGPGIGAGLGKRIGHEEVSAIEKVVQALGVDEGRPPGDEMEE